MLKKTNNKRKTLKGAGVLSAGRAMVKKKSSVKELTEQFEIDHFLIDEQIFYTGQLERQLADNRKKTEPMVSGLDRLLKVEPAQAATIKKMEKMLTAGGVKVSLTKQGQQVNQNDQLAQNSVFTLDLRKENAPKKEPVFVKVKDNFLYREFKVTQPTFDLPAPTFLKKQWLKGAIEKFKAWQRIFKKSRFIPALVQPAAKRQSWPWLWRLRVALNFALVALLFIVPIRGYLFYQQAKEVKGKVLGAAEEALTGFSQGLESVTVSDWPNAVLSFNQSAASFTQAQKTVAGFNQSILAFLEALPVASQQVKQGQDLLAAGELFSRAAVTLTQAAGQLNVTPGLTGPAAEPFLAINNALDQSIVDLKQAFLKLAAVSPSLIPEGERDKFILIQNSLPALLKNLDNLKSLIDLSLKFLGYEEPQRYLFVFQNQNELRGTGGFMGSYALVDLKNGKIANLEVPGGGFYDLKGNFFEKVIGPTPLHLLGTPWMIWDANWWPDFPTSMKKLLWFYEKSGGPSVDGVVAFNAQVLSELLKLTGNITLAEYDQVFTPETVVLALQHETEFEYDKDKNQPKEVIGDLMKVLIERLMKIPANELLPLILTLNGNLERKDIQLYFTDDDLQNEAQSFGWTGHLAEAAKDYLLVTRANVAGGKTDGVIKQEIKHYAYVQPDGSMVDTAAVTLTHQGNLNDIFEKVLNKSYVRVYVPLGSVLLEASGYDTLDPSLFKEVYPGYQPDQDLLAVSGQIKIDSQTNTSVNNEFNKTVFGNWLVLAPGESKTLTFSYRLPFKLNFGESRWEKLLVALGVNEPALADSYSLLVQKQSGSVRTSLESRLYFTSGLKVVWSEATGQKPIDLKENYTQFLTDLEKDYSYSLLLKNR